LQLSNAQHASCSHEKLKKAEEDLKGCAKQIDDCQLQMETGIKDRNYSELEKNGRQLAILGRTQERMNFMQMSCADKRNVAMSPMNNMSSENGVRYQTTNFAEI